MAKKKKKELERDVADCHIFCNFTARLCLVMTESKIYGRVYTPAYLVNHMLDCMGYDACARIVQKHIIDNSCGDGAFLVEIVHRYCKAFQGSKEELKSNLETYVHGIEIDFDECNKCLMCLDNTARQFGVENVRWDIRCADALSVTKYEKMMDYVVGNPPYVRVHNLESSYAQVKSYKFANGGMTDLYLAFFELGFKMLKSDGQLCYISPSSWLNSLATANMRKYIVMNQNLVALIDMEHFQAFDKITTYTIISHFKKSHCSNNFDYYTYNKENNSRTFVAKLKLQECYIDSYFYLGTSEQLRMLQQVKGSQSNKYVSVKNGFATLADSVFIGDEIPESPITIKVVKGSTGKWYNCLFPYDHNGKPLSEEVVFENEEVKSHFIANKEALLKGNAEYAGWYLFGRTQALADVYRPKLSVNALIRTKSDFKLVELKSGEGIYSGLYVVTNIDIPFCEIKEIIASNEFVEYIKLLRKYKSGGYYTFNSKDVEQFINYTLTYKQKGCKYVVKPRISRQNPDLFQGVY